MPLGRLVPGPVRRLASATLAPAIVLTVGLGLTTAADAERFAIPKLIRMTGHVGDPLPTDVGAEDWYLGYKDKQFRFQCEHLKVLSDATLPASIVAHVDIYRPNFTLYGDPKLMEKLDTATPNQTVQITGYYRRSSRDILVNDVTVQDPGTPGAPTPGATE